MVPSIIPPSQWHSRDSNLWLWLWYHLFDRELCHFTSKPIDNEKDTLKSFMTFDITACMPVFGVIVESQIMIPNRNIYTYKQTINRINNRRKIIIHISIIMENARDTKNLTIVVTTCHMASYKLWRSNGGSTPPLLVTRHMINCDKSCEIFCVPSITQK